MIGDCALHCIENATINITQGLSELNSKDLKKISNRIYDAKSSNVNYKFDLVSIF